MIFSTIILERLDSVGRTTLFARVLPRDMARDFEAWPFQVDPRHFTCYDYADRKVGSKSQAR